MHTNHRFQLDAEGLAGVMGFNPKIQHYQVTLIRQRTRVSEDLHVFRIDVYVRAMHQSGSLAS
jgi:hypothetical protein